MRKKKKIKIIAKKKKKIEGRRFCLCFCLGHTYTPEKKKKNLAAGRKKQKKQQIYIPVFRVALLFDILWSVGGKKKTETETERKKSNIPSQLGKSIDLPLVLKNFSLHITKKNGPLFLKINIK